MKDSTVIMIMVLILLVGLYLFFDRPKGLAETAYNL